MNFSSNFSSFAPFNESSREAFTENISDSDSNLNPNRFREQNRYPERYGTKFNSEEPENIRIPEPQSITYANNNKTNTTRLLNDAMSFRQITGDRLKSISNKSINNFVGTIYNNFIELSDYPQLKHTAIDIHKLLTSTNLIMYTVSKNNIMIAYCVGELMKLDDGRYVLYISYIYVGSRYRRNGLGSVLINKMIDYAKFKGMDALMLICNTEDIRVMNFYFDKGFAYDQYLRRYDKYDVLTLNL